MHRFQTGNRWKHFSIHKIPLLYIPTKYGDSFNIFQQFPRRLLTVETLPTFKTVPAVGGGKYHFKLAAVRLFDRG